MTPSTRWALAVVTACVSMVPLHATAQPPLEPEDQTLSPYFLAADGDAVVDRLPLKDTRVSVSIVGAIADVTVRQVYENAGERPLHARYVFPASRRATVYGMTMTVGKVRMVARIREREEAVRAFERAKHQGRSASLLEQNEPNLFTMNVANVLPGDAIAVELRYTELLTQTDGQYEFVFPTVAGPRSSNAPESQTWTDDVRVEALYTHDGGARRSRFHVAVSLSTGVPIQGLTSPSHQMVIRSIGLGRAEMALASTAQPSGTRDFILRYRLAGRRVGSDLLLHEDRSENFFLLMAEPPEAVTPDQTQAPQSREIDSPLLTDINVTFREFETYDVEPEEIPDLFARRPIVVFGKWRGIPWGSIEISGEMGRGMYQSCVAVTPESANGSHVSLRHLWARSRVETLSDFDPSIPDEHRAANITSLGLTNGLLTRYTSLVAVGEIIRRTSDDAVDVDQSSGAD